MPPLVGQHQARETGTDTDDPKLTLGEQGLISHRHPVDRDMSAIRRLGSVRVLGAIRGTVRSLSIIGDVSAIGRLSAIETVGDCHDGGEKLCVALVAVYVLIEVMGTLEHARNETDNLLAVHLLHLYASLIILIAIFLHQDPDHHQLWVL